MTDNVNDIADFKSIQDREKLSGEHTDNIKKHYYNALKHLAKANSKRDEVNTAIWEHIVKELKKLLKTWWEIFIKRVEIFILMALLMILIIVMSGCGDRKVYHYASKIMSFCIRLGC